MSLIIYCILVVFNLAATTDPINIIIKDESFISVFGRTPDINDSENLRIKTHLQYVHDMLKSD